MLLKNQQKACFTREEGGENLIGEFLGQLHQAGGGVIRMFLAQAINNRFNTRHFLLHNDRLVWIGMLRQLHLISKSLRDFARSDQVNLPRNKRMNLAVENRNWPGSVADVGRPPLDGKAILTKF